MVMAVKTSRKHNIVKEGYMIVQSQSVWRKWCWEAKYIVLTKYCLQYGIAQDSRTSEEETSILYLEDISVSINEEKRGVRTQYYIRVKSRKQNKSINMYCLNESDRDDWMTKILLVLAMQHAEDAFTEEKKDIGSMYKTLSLPDITTTDEADDEDDQERPISWLQFLSKCKSGGEELSPIRQCSTKSSSTSSPKDIKRACSESRTYRAEVQFHLSTQASEQDTQVDEVCNSSSFLSEYIFVGEKENTPLCSHRNDSVQHDEDELYELISRSRPRRSQKSRSRSATVSGRLTTKSEFIRTTNRM